MRSSLKEYLTEIKMVDAHNTEHITCTGLDRPELGLQFSPSLAELFTVFVKDLKDIVVSCSSKLYTK